MTAARLRRVATDTSGVSTVEFALVAPVLLVAVMGLFDLGYTMYTNSMLQGAIHQAARASTIEGAGTRAADIDKKVEEAVKAVVYSSDLTFSRKSYASFSDVAQPEDFSDIDTDGTCNNGEPYEDANGNGNWDQDRGSDGQGGARDAVLYTVRVTYARPFPIASLIGQDNSFTLETQTVLRNQPYGLQSKPEPATGNCT